MGYSEKTRRKLEYLINRGKTHEERVKISFDAGKTIITKPTSDKIRNDYDAINRAIDSLDTKDILFPKKKYELQQLKKDVPRKYAISKGAVEELQEVINKILAQKNPLIRKQED